MGSILTRNYRYRPNPRYDIFEDDDDDDFQIQTYKDVQKEEMTEQLVKVSTTQQEIIRKYNHLATKMDTQLSYIKLLTKEIELIRTNIEETYAKMSSKYAQMNSKYEQLESKNTLYDILHNIKHEHIEYFCNKHQRENSISWLPDNVEKNIYLNCLTFLKVITNENLGNVSEGNITDGNVSDTSDASDVRNIPEQNETDEMFYSIRSTKDSVIWNDKTI